MRPSPPLRAPGKTVHRRPIPLAILAIVVAVLPLSLLAGCASTPREGEAPGPRWKQTGWASWYGHPFHGRTTASGEVYDMYGLTAAHRTLPFGTTLEVEDLETGRTVLVVVNDRGPFVRGRIVDLSYGAARALGIVDRGLARVRLRVVSDRTGVAAERSFTVQVGAFRDRSLAEALAEHLRRRYDGVRIESDGEWHRVRIGALAGREAAEALRRRLLRNGIEGVVVTVATAATGTD